MKDYKVIVIKNETLDNSVELEHALKDGWIIYDIQTTDRMVVYILTRKSENPAGPSDEVMHNWLDDKDNSIDWDVD